MATPKPDADDPDKSPDPKSPPPDLSEREAPEISSEALWKFYDEFYDSLPSFYNPIQKLVSLEQECIARGLPPPFPRSEPKDFQPTLFFFYGSLMIPEWLQKVLELPEPPVLEKAHTRVLKTKLWGQNPALIARTTEDWDEYDEDPDPVLSGCSYTVSSEEHLKRLIEHQGKNYKIGRVLLVYPGENRMPIEANTFVWKGDPEDPRLTDGKFDVDAFKAEKGLT
ncbi:hypothetical protein TWF696_004017 [Orbilia brochopaga]|uniref:Gamma-glutamylcyclotransferase AIG2-like domain-containing protein n=1 Tax=Orbilia brochopaga TaxID=3140254 RepID=A0AAV9VBE1_9PEZI